MLAWGDAEVVLVFLPQGKLVLDSGAGLLDLSLYPGGLYCYNRGGSGWMLILAVPPRPQHKTDRSG